MAIAFCSIGFAGKLIGDAIEQTSPGSIEARQAVGACKGALLNYGYWSQIKLALWSLVLLRWDINVRESAVPGIVDAGGIGMTLDTAMNLFQWQRVAVVLIAIFAMVVVAEMPHL